MKIENKEIGVLVAFVLAFVMLFLPGPDRGRYSFDPEKLSEEIMKRDDHVSPGELSEWIIQGKNDFRLVDIRTAKEYKNGSIKKAENIPLRKLLKKDTLERLIADKQVVIFSNGNSHAHQAWVVLKSAGVDVLVLEGGFNLWNKIVLNPKLPVNITDDEVLRYKGRVAVANYFGGGGTEMSAGSEPDSKKKTPKQRKKKKKKKLEGC